MRRRTTGLAAALLVLASNADLSFSQSTDETAIKEVVWAESATFFANDAGAWEDTWLHDPTATRTLIFPGYADAKLGWDSFGPLVIEEIRNYPQPDGIEFSNDNYIIHTDGGVAWVEYDQTVKAPSLGPDYETRSRERRALLKRDGAWKIVSQITVGADVFGSSPEAIEANLNAVGYNLLGAEKVDEAIEVFKLNVRFFPKSWNTYDSLGEAYAVAGNKALAIENYERSLELNPDSPSGQEALARLRE